MQKLQLTDFRNGEAWLIIRLDAQVQNQSVDVYMTMDLPSGVLLAFQTIDGETVETRHMETLLGDSHLQKQRWPGRIILAKGDPAEDLVRASAETHNIRLEGIPESQLEDLIQPVKASYGKHVFSPASMAYSSLADDIDEMDRESAKRMVPDAYDPCWCASGKKFKFCCKPIFRQIVGAMVCAEEGRREEALALIEDAKKVVGETAEVLCREAIVWSRFDPAKSSAILSKALQINSKHPRANYILGIELKAKGNYTGAIAAYLRAIDCYPKTDRFHLNEAYNNLGTAYFESGDALKAKAAWEQALILMPSDKVVRRNLLDFIYTNENLSTADRAIGPFVRKFFEKPL